MVRRRLPQAMQIARLVDERPDVGETSFDHQASVANITAIARVRANPRIGERVEAVIGGWLRRAERTEYDDLARTVRTWEQRHDAEHARQLTESADERRTAIRGSDEHGGGGPELSSDSERRDAAPRSGDPARLSRRRRRG